MCNIIHKISIPKDIHYLSKRRINQLIISQIAKPSRCKNHDRDNVETCTVLDMFQIIIRGIKMKMMI